MPSSSGFTGTGLFIESVVQLSINTIKITYGQDPLAVSASGINDALNPLNYALSGAYPNSIASVSKISGDPQTFVLTTQNQLNTGSWILTVSNVKTPTATLLVPNPTVISFNTSGATSQPPLGLGGIIQDATLIIKKHLPDNFKNKDNWEALISALAAGDDYLFDLAVKAFNQLFLASAGGDYLSQRGADIGFIRPSGIGLDDEIFRQLLIELQSEKLTYQTFCNILEIFYGPDDTRASITSVVEEPYPFGGGEDLLLQIDGKLLTVVFDSTDFRTLGNASALELATALNSYFSEKGLGAFANVSINVATGKNRVKIYSGNIGLKGKVACLGGKAQFLLNFPTSISTSQAIGTQWTVSTSSPFKVRFTHSGGTAPGLNLVSVGDYIQVYGSVFNPVNRGTFTITGVNPIASGGYVEFTNSSGTIETVTQTAISDVLFFTPEVFTVIRNENPAFIAEASAQADIFLPATPAIVNRSPNEAAYLFTDSIDTQSLQVIGTNQLDILSITGAGVTTTLKTATNHGLINGDSFYFGPNYATLTKNLPEGEYVVTGTTSNTVNISYNSGGVYAETFITGYKIFKSYRKNTGNINFTANTVIPTSVSVGDIISLENCNTALLSNQILNKTVTTSIYSTARPSYTEVGNNKVLFSGGDLGAGAINDAYIFDKGTETVTTIASMKIKRAGHGLVCRGNKVFCFGGMDETGTIVSSCEVYDLNTDEWAPIASMNVSRYYGLLQNNKRGFVLPNGNILVYGGLSNGGIYSSTGFEIYSTVTDTWTSQNTAIGSRTNFGSAQHPDGRVFVFGGVDGLGAYSNGIVYDPIKNTWISISDTLTTELRQMSTGLYWDDGSQSGKILFIGGADFLAATNYSDVLVIDPFNLSLSTITLPLGLRVAHAFQLNKEHFIILNGAGAAGVVSNFYIYNKTSNDWETFASATAGQFYSWFTQISNFRYWGINGSTVSCVIDLFDKSSFSGQINGEYSVLSKNNNQLTLSPLFRPILDWAPIQEVVSGQYAVANRAKAFTQTKTYGPYILDKSPELTAFTATLNQSIAQNTSQSILNVSNMTTGFPASGFIVIGYGTKYQTQPIPYIFKISSNQIKISQDYVFEQTIPSGTSVWYLSSTDLFDPANPTSLGLFYATDTSSTRIFAENLIDQVKATGSDIVQHIVYPGTVGLGNSQISSDITGQSKLNDAIYIWGDQAELDKKRSN